MPPYLTNGRSRPNREASASGFHPAYLPPDSSGDDTASPADSAANSDVFMDTTPRKLLSGPYAPNGFQDEILTANPGGVFSPNFQAGPPDAAGHYESNRSRSNFHYATPDDAYKPHLASLPSDAAPAGNADPYSARLADVGGRLESAYAAKRPGTARQIFGALLSRHHPEVAGIVSGETQRNRQIEPLQQEYGLLSDIIAKNRAQNLADLNAQNVGSEIHHRTEQENYWRNPKPTPQEQAVQDYMTRINPATKKNYSPAEALKQVNQDAQDVKPERATHTSPFEAFAYGDPQEKKAAQDFLAFEKRMGAQYQRPTDAEVRYQLFQRDPEGYKDVFGDRGQAAGDRAHATRMLNFFQKQRDTIQKDFMLGDDEKAQKLQEIDQLQKPFADATGVGGAGNSGSDRVNVIHPNGAHGTIPRSQLPAAKRKGYREAQ